jgi:hypothetical protein
MVNFPPGIVSELHRTDSIDYFVVLEVRQTSLVWHGDRRCFRARLFSRSKTARRRSSGKATPAATSRSCMSGTTGPIAWQGASGCLCCFEIDGASGCSLCSFRPSPSRSTANLLASTASARKAASWQWHSNGRAYGWHGCIPISRSKPTLLRPSGDPVCCQRLPAVSHVAKLTRLGPSQNFRFDAVLVAIIAIARRQKSRSPSDPRQPVSSRQHLYSISQSLAALS